MLDRNLQNELTRRFEQLGDDLIIWIKSVTKLLDGEDSDTFYRKQNLTASISWGFVNKKLNRKVEKWYLLLQDAVDDVDDILTEFDMDQITPEIEQHIRKVFSPRLVEYQNLGKEFISTYEEISDNLDHKVWLELKDIVFEVDIENIINILKEMFDV